MDSLCHCHGNMSYITSSENTRKWFAGQWFNKDLTTEILMLHLLHLLEGFSTEAVDVRRQR